MAAEPPAASCALATSSIVTEFVMDGTKGQSSFVRRTVAAISRCMLSQSKSNPPNLYQANIIFPSAGPSPSYTGWFSKTMPLPGLIIMATTDDTANEARNMIT